MNIPLDWTLIFAIGGFLDFVLLAYRWYRTVGIVARIIRGKDVEVALKHLTVKKDEKKCCEGRKFADKFLSMIMWCHDKFYYLQYSCVKLCYWITVLFQLFVAGAIILMLYIIVDQILTVDFINQLGTFSLMTTGIAAQRAVRNQVLSTTALSYNNYTISTIDQATTDFAQDKNQESWEWNIEELKRVDEWNAYFCNAWASYQSTVRDISNDDDLIYNSSAIYMDQLSHVFDQTSNISFNPMSVYNESDHLVVIDVELPMIEFTDNDSSYWDISQIQIEWDFYIDNDAGYSTSDDYISIQIQSKLESTQNWMDHVLNGQDEYPAASYSKLNDVQSINMYLNETRFIRIIFSNSSKWSNAFAINEIKIYGAAPTDKIVCDKVQFHFWSFDASDVVMEECPSITPVFGNMYRGFVRSWINDQLLDAHTPFILAVRNIALSPFFILFAAILILMVVFILGFIIEWLLIRFDLFRENVYAKVPLVTTNWQDYDPDLHYVTTHSGSEDDDDDTDHDDEKSDDEIEELGGGIYLSPTSKKRRYLASSARGEYFSPLPNKDKTEKEEIEMGVISPRLVELEQAVLRSAEKVRNKFRELTGRNRGHQQLLSPNDTSSARDLAQMLFNEMEQNQANKASKILGINDADPEIDSNVDSDIDQYDDNDRCKQQ